jgi:hypothetical protein
MKRGSVMMSPPPMSIAEQKEEKMANEERDLTAKIKRSELTESEIFTSVRTLIV